VQTLAYFLKKSYFFLFRRAIGQLFRIYEIRHPSAICVLEDANALSKAGSSADLAKSLETIDGRTLLALLCPVLA